ncbi:MAG: 2-keto-3-deoxy-L-rhamnonate aldolase, partial [Pseudomonadales bacterium]
IKTVRGAVKYAGLLCVDESQVEHYVACGANFVGVGVDTLLIGNAARSLAATFKSTNSDDDTPSPAGY